MKEELLAKLETFKRDLQSLRRNVALVQGERVTQLALRNAADALADTWVETLRSPLEHRFKIPADVIAGMSDTMKRLHVLSRPNNRKTSYTEALNTALRDFDDRFVLPIKQTAVVVKQILDLQKLIPGLNPEDSEYLKEAIDCATAGFKRAAVVMGWCAAINHVHKKVQAVGFDKFNAASRKVKAQTSGRFARWNKEFKIGTLSEMQEVSDKDLIVVLEGLDLLDSNQADRLVQVDYQYRNQSAHPGQAPIEDAHLVAFFTDITNIVLKNPKLA